MEIEKKKTNRKVEEKKEKKIALIESEIIELFSINTEKLTEKRENREDYHTKKTSHKIDLLVLLQEICFYNYFLQKQKKMYIWIDSENRVNENKIHNIANKIIKDFREQIEVNLGIRKKDESYKRDTESILRRHLYGNFFLNKPELLNSIKSYCKKYNITNLNYLESELGMQHNYLKNQCPNILLKEI